MPAKKRLLPMQPAARSANATISRSGCAAKAHVRQATLALNEIESKRIENAVAAFVERRRPPAHLRDQIDLAFRFDGRSVEIFEIRPRWNKPDEKVEESVAKARYVKTRGEWLVYWKRADLKWHKYPPKPAVRTLQAFLSLVEEDEYSCFFG